MTLAQDDPKSRLGPLGWTLLIVLAYYVTMQTSHNVKSTLWYKFRPNNWPVNITPFAMFLIWTTAKVTLAVAFYYFLTVTSNSGWINNLFPNLGYDYDAMAGLLLVSMIWMNGYGYFFWLMDSWNYTYTIKQVRVGDQIAAGFRTEQSEAALEERIKRVKDRREAEQITKDTPVDQFKQNTLDFHLNNDWVRWGMFVYSLAFLTIGVVIMSFLARKYGNGKNDHSYLVIFGLWVFTLVVILFGFLFQCYTSFGFSNKNWEKQITPELVRRRALETMTY